MAAMTHKIGTPDQHDAKQRRLHSPFPSPVLLEEMDGDEGNDEDRSGCLRQPSFEPSPPTPVTMDGIAKLLKDNLAPLASKVTDLEGKFDGLSATMGINASLVDSKFSDMNKKFEAEIASIQKDIKTMRISCDSLPPSVNSTPRNSRTDERSVTAVTVTAVTSGLVGMQEDDAKEWIKNKLWELWGPTPVDVYTKGDFNGMVFCKFQTEVEKEQAISIVRANTLTYGDKEIKMWPDAPAVERIPKSFLFALKRLLLKWDYDKKSLWVDEAGKILKIGDEIVISTGVDGTDLITDFGEGWADFLRCAELEEMMKTHKERLKRSLTPKKGTGKGKGKAGKAKGPE